MAREKAAGPRRLGFSGRLTLANADALRNKMLKALKSERVEIAFGKVQAVDLSFLQLLCSALRTAAGTSRLVTVADKPVPDAVRELVEAAGMVSPAGCKEDGFWRCLAGRNGGGKSLG